MEIVRTKTFDKSLKKMGATVADLASLFAEISANPDAGDVVQGTGGARKIRFALAGRGKRGGARAVYFAFIREGVAYMLMAYAKNEKTDLTAEDKEALADFIEELKNG